MKWGRMERRRNGLSSANALVAAGIALLALAGCGSSGVSVPTLGAGNGGTSTTALVTTTATAATPDRMDGNPFQDSNVIGLSGREVIANPTLAEVMQPSSSLPEMSLGRADAPVTLIKYASMTCPYCRQFQMEVFPELKRQYIDTGKLRLILREFPIGFQSGLATVALRCVPKSKYFQAYDKLMRQQNQWVSQEIRPEPIAKVMADLGLSAGQFEACRQDKVLVGALNAVKERGRTLGIVGTPNFFINGRLVKSTLTLRDVKALIDPLLTGSNPATTQKS